MTPSGPLQYPPSSPKASDPDDRIEQAVKARNDLRRGVLPLLDEQTEIAQARAVMRRREFEGVKEVHRPVLDQFMRDTLAEFQRERGPRFGDSFGAHYLVSLIAHQRFDEYLELHGIRPSKAGDGTANEKPCDGEPA